MPNSIPSIQSAIVASNPAMMVSDPSIRTVKRNSKITRILLFLLVAVALLALVATISLTIKQTNTNKIQVEKEEAFAREIKHVNARTIRDPMSEVIPIAEDKFISFNIATKPDGADIYLDGKYIGTTDPEQNLEKKLPKLEKKAKLIVSLDGYYLAKKTFPLYRDFYDTVILEKIPENEANSFHGSDTGYEGHSSGSDSRPSGNDNSDSAEKGISGIIIPD